MFSMFGGPVFWLLYFGILLCGHAITAFQTYWLGRWARAYAEAEDWHQVSVAYWLGLYAAWIAISFVAFTIASILYYIGAIKASREMHRRLVNSIFGGGEPSLATC